MNIQAYLLGVIVFSVFIVTGVFLMADINKNYAGIITENISTSEYSTTYNTIDKMYNISKDQKEQVLGTELTSDNIVDSSYKGAFSAARLIKNTFELIGNVIQETSNALHVPTYFIKFAFAAIIIVVIFSLIALILRFK